MFKSFSVALASILALAACDGSSSSTAAAAAAADPAASDVVASPPGATPGTTPQTPPSTPTNGNPLTPPPPPPPADPVVTKHCNVSSTGEICIENAQGHVGDVVEVEVILTGNSVCTTANEAGGRLSFDFAKLLLQNPADVVDCRTRRIGQDPVTNADTLFWSAFGNQVVPGCNDIPSGKADTIKLKIAPGTPPGDYALTWSNADGYYIPAMGSDASCTFGGSPVSGTLHVLP